MSQLRRFAARLFHQRKLQNLQTDSALRRCLTLFDLTILGIGSTVGAGLYVVTGELARNVAGPALIISFFIASVAALLSGLCYAEFGSRIPKAGSAYIYTYVVLGEFFAFVVGWNMILEYLIAAASLARSCSEYINSIAGGVIFKFFMEEIATWHVPWLGSFPDFLALGIALAITIIVCLGVKKSSMFTNVAAMVNLIVITFVIIAGLYFMDVSHWSTPAKFAPYGVEGILTAAGSAFYVFVGVDILATAGEEAIKPSITLPLATLLCLAVSFTAYFGVATLLTMVVSYDKLARYAALAEAFAARGFLVGKYIVSTGAIFAILCTISCTVFAAPRVVYSMASDGLLFNFFAKVNEKTQIPVRAAICNFILVGFLAVLLDVKQLVEMLSIGALTAYSLVSIAVILTRYQPGVDSVSVDNDQGKAQFNRKWLKKLCCAKEDDDGDEDGLEYRGLVNDINAFEDNEQTPFSMKYGPTSASFCRASIATIFLVLAIFGLCLTMTLGFDHLRAKSAWAIVFGCAFVLVIIVSLMVLERQPKNNATFPFMVPGCPYLPALSLFVNILLVVKLNHWTYVRFGVWLVVGLLIYGCYGYRHSKEGLVPSSDSDRGYVISPTPPIGQTIKEMQPGDQ